MLLEGSAGLGSHYLDRKKKSACRKRHSDSLRFYAGGRRHVYLYDMRLLALSGCAVVLLRFLHMTFSFSCCHCLPCVRVSMKFQEEVIAALPVTPISSVGSKSFSPSLLVEEAQKHIRFLERLHATGVTLQQPSRKSVERYTNVWLPLVAELGCDDDDTTKLLPPPDVAWLWHCHRLAPVIYENYTMKRFGCIIETNTPFDFQDEKSDDAASVATQNAWFNKYPDKLFFLVKGEKDENTFSPALVGGFDLVASCLRQNTFLWQISRPYFRDASFLREAEKQYYKFLALKNDDDDDGDSRPQKQHALIPTFPIDLMWHTHMLVSIQNYNKECLAIRGEKFHHDDSFDDRTAGGELDVSFTRTCRLWEKVYGESYVVPGAMYRGEPPAAYFDKTWNSLLLKVGKDAEDCTPCPAAGCGGGCGNRGGAGCGGGCGGGGCGNKR